uniref:Uncharacterized protein n=1 Tax=Gossypium raimondii TaxID=29730 RepID=A0A0D2UWQ1_GOSRA|nr:hypothetical protein B456_011G222000 [Gossypium raimondii]
MILQSYLVLRLNLKLSFVYYRELEMPPGSAELSFVVEMPNDYYKERRFEWCFLLQLDDLLSSKGHCM